MQPASFVRLSANEYLNVGSGLMTTLAFDEQGNVTVSFATLDSHGKPHQLTRAADKGGRMLRRLCELHTIPLPSGGPP
jgi:hypothetical protein